VELLTALFGLLGLILFKLYGWVVIVAILGYLIWQNRRKTQWVEDTEHILLLIEVPKDNDKKELSAEQMFASLHGILRPKSDLIREGVLQEHISFEVVSVGNQIKFYVWTPKHLKDFVEGQIYAQYPTVHIREVEHDYAHVELGSRVVYGTELHLTKPDVLPIKTFQSFEVDPLAGITAVLAKIEELGGEMWIQVLARPIDDSWQEKGMAYIEAVKNGKTKPVSANILDAFLELPLYVLKAFFNALFAPAKDEKKKEEKKEEKKEDTGQSTIIKAIEEKTTKLGYGVKVRIAYLGPDQDLAKQRLQAIVGGFKQFNTTNLNGFTASKYHDNEDFLHDYQARVFMDGGHILNIEELASLYHLPHTSVETPNMVWTTSKTSEPPSNLPTEVTTEPTEVSLFGMTNFRGANQKFGIKRRDRGRHMYIIGQTGAGKSGLLQLLTLNDIYHDQGIAIIDPHGDYATDMMKFVPEHRLNDVVYMNPTDTMFPMAFNPMEVFDENLKNHISSEIVGVLKRMFVDSWGPRLEYILRYTILALLDTPDSTMLGITRMLTEKGYRKKVIANIKDPVVRNFWVSEFASWNEKFASEAVAPVLNKVGAFVANPLVRNIIGQPRSAFNIRQIMDEGKILVVNLSRGQVGEDNAAILGALLVTKIQLAAMSRADIPEADRRPFYLYVDEFQNFATDSFAVILSEARKYGLNLTVANQYISQMPETVRDAVFGNVGTMVSFRVGPGDATVVGPYFAPAFEPADITTLNNQHIFVSMIIDGQKSIPFSATTLMLPKPENDQTPKLIELSRERFASDKASVEEEIRRWAGDELYGDAKIAVPVGNNYPSPEKVNQQIRDEQKPNILTELKNPEHKPAKPAPRRDDRPVKAKSFEGDKPNNDDQILDVKTDILTHKVDPGLIQAGQEVSFRNKQ
jgi:hypothetical protein